MNAPCIRCKGRGFCGRSYCPHILRSNSAFKVKGKLSGSDFSSSAPAPFVGHVGYPYVNIGILTPPEKSENAWEYDAPKHWSKSGYAIDRIVDFRSSLINSRAKARVIGSNRFLDIAKEVGMAKKPVDVDVSLEDRPRFHLSTSAQLAPMGPRGELKKAAITSNPSVDSRVEKVVDDDLRATDALGMLYDKKFDENFLTRLFTVGNLGMAKDRKLVPTRWSITAVDDTLGKNLHAKVTGMPEVSDFLVYFGDYLGNYYIFLMLPDVWSYELFETYMPKASWNTSDRVDFTTDYESYTGRTKYAENCAGGYYSVRLAVLEKLKELKRQASVLALRVITGDYSVPLGVWVTREAARKALSSRPLRFASAELAVRYANALCKKKFGFDAGVMTSKSKVLKENRTQMKLANFV